MFDPIAAQVARAKYPLDWEVGSVGTDEYAFMNLPTGVIYQFGSTPPIYVPGVHINLVEPHGDADAPKRGMYWEKIPEEFELMLDPSVTSNEPQILVEEGEWAKPGYDPAGPKADF